jgi:hypothetical protein
MKAVPPCGNERDVKTIITRPLWRAWLRSNGDDENIEPTAWLGVGKTHRIYGSETIVIERDYMAAISIPCNQFGLSDIAEMLPLSKNRLK